MLSIGLHIALVMILFAPIFHHSRHSRTGITPSVPAYLYTNIQKKSLRTEKRTAPKKRMEQTYRSKHGSIKKRRSTTTRNIREINSGPTQGQPSKLLNALHNKIQRFQRYPEAAQLLGQSGTARLIFILFPNGKIADLKIEESSGYQDLDQAALNAVKDASPFRIARKYIQRAARMDINIVFSKDL